MRDKRTQDLSLDMGIFFRKFEQNAESLPLSTTYYTDLDGKLALVGSWIWVGLLTDGGHPA